MMRRVTVSTSVVILFLAFVLCGAACERSDHARESAGDELPVGRSFASWADYVQAIGGATRSPRKVVFIGIDGACWNIINPLIDEGILPAFARLKSGGASGVLRSVDCYVSPPAWTSMMTGYKPERSGVFTFGIWDEERREFLNIDARDVKVPSIWDVTSFAGRPTAVTNVPVTYPVRAVDGIMVSGLLTPASLAERQSQRTTFQPSRAAKKLASHSPVLHATVDFSATRFDIYLTDRKDDGRASYDVAQVTISYHDKPDMPANAAFLISHYSDWLPIRFEHDGRTEDAWCKLLVLPTETPGEYTVATSTVFFDVGDTEVSLTYPEALQSELKLAFDHYLPSKFVTRYIVPSLTEEHARYATFFRDYADWDLFAYVFTQTDNIQHLDGVSPITKLVYKAIDRYLQGVMDELPDDTVLIVASDHGFAEYRYAIDLNKMFEQMGLLVYEDGTNIDYGQTLAFHNLWCVYFNKDLLTRPELQKRGIAVEAGQAPRDALLDYLALHTPPLQMADGGAEVTVELSPLPANAFASAPDMIVKGTYPDCIVEFWNLTRPGEAVVSALDAGETWNHTREGMYAFYGRDVRRGLAGAVEDIQDVAPTVLYLLGLPRAADMDGRVIHSIFRKGAMPATIDVVEDYGQVYAGASSEAEREALEKKLRSLGYIR